MISAEFMATVKRDNARAKTVRKMAAVKPPGAGYVLVIEDDQDVREAVSDTLRAEGLDVIEAINGVEALRVLDQQYMLGQAVGDEPRVPLVILLDLMLPVKSGLEFYKELRRSRPMFDAVPVLIMSASENVKNFDWIVNVAGLVMPKGVLSKPFEAEELTSKVFKAIAHDEEDEK